MATCADCDQPILWFKTAANGRSIPVDCDRVLGGNITLDENGFACVVKPDRGQMRYVTHWATCPVLIERRGKKAQIRRDAKKAAPRRQLGLFDVPDAATGRK